MAFLKDRHAQSKQRLEVHRLRADSVLAQKAAPVTQVMREKAPQAAKALDEAFYQSLKRLFTGEKPLAYRTLKKPQRRAEYRQANAAVAAQGGRGLKKLERQATRGSVLTAAFSAVEGTGLGILGVGLPDIPLIIGVVLNAACKIAWSYGFDPELLREKVYILEVLGFAAGNKESRSAHFEKMQAIEQDETLPLDLEDALRRCAQTLSDTLCAAKFVQGAPVIGVVGGAFNLWLCNSVQNNANDAYRTRYLQHNLTGGDRTSLLDALLGR